MHYVHQDGQAVYKFAVRKMAEAAEIVLTRNGVTGKDLACFIPHQANKRIILSTAERLGMPEDRVVINIDRFGNTTAATIPMAMQTALDDKRLKKGDLVLLASVGAGFTVGATLLRWEFLETAKEEEEEGRGRGKREEAGRFYRSPYFVLGVCGILLRLLSVRYISLRYGD